MLGGDHLLAGSGLLAAAEAFDLGDRSRGHDDAAPAAAGEYEHRPDQAQGAGLAGEAADHLRAAADLDERSPDPLERIRLAVDTGQHIIKLAANRSLGGTLAMRAYLHLRLVRSKRRLRPPYFPPAPGTAPRSRTTSIPLGPRDSLLLIVQPGSERELKWDAGEHCFRRGPAVSTGAP